MQHLLVVLSVRVEPRGLARSGFVLLDFCVFFLPYNLLKDTN